MGRKSKEWIGNKYGNLTVLNNIRAGNKYYCECLCTCGKLVKVRSCHLSSGCVKSCGCYRVSYLRDLYRVGTKDICKSYYDHLKTGASNRNLCFDITIDWMQQQLEKQEYKCYYTNLPIMAKFTSSCDFTASIDRIDSRYGYNINNCVWVHKHINIIKSNFSEKELYSWMKKVCFPKKETYSIDLYKFGRMYKGYFNISATYWNRLRRNAQNRNIEFDLSIEDVWGKYVNQGASCAVTGENIVFSKPKHKLETMTASVDRVDNNIGYTLDNIQWVHKFINKMRGSLSLDSFYYFAYNICSNRKFIGCFDGNSGLVS